MRQNKRDEIVKQALAIFYRNGFHATGMDRLVAESGISKTSMYKHFKTKEDLILAALALRDQMFRDWMVARIEALANQPRDRILALFDALQEWFDTPEFRGCMFIKAAAEFQDETHPVRRQSARHKALIEQHIRDLAMQAGIAQPDRIARQIMLLKEGAIITAHVMGRKTAAADAKDAAAKLLQV